MCPRARISGPLESFGFTRSSPARKTCRPAVALSTCSAVKASGVTFAISAMERVIEERCRGGCEQGGQPARSAARPDRRRHPLGEAGLGSAAKAQGAAHLGRSVVASTSKWRSVRTAEIFTKGADALDGRLGRLDRSCAPTRRGTIPSPRSCSAVDSGRPHPRRRRSATTSTCVTSKAAARCC
jgi:hypothetical protein